MSRGDLYLEPGPLSVDLAALSTRAHQAANSGAPGAPVPACSHGYLWTSLSHWLGGTCFIFIFTALLLTHTSTQVFNRGLWLLVEH